ncbi:MAG: SRPBCC domain-containing protein [Pseudoxanthomonas sp.]
MTGIAHRVGIKVPRSAVYPALATLEGIAAWWTANTSGVCAVGGTINLEFTIVAGERVGAMRMQVMTLDPDTQVRWHCTAGPEEWIDTDVVFDLSCEDDYTIVRFGHRHWREAVEFTSTAA